MTLREALDRELDRSIELLRQEQDAAPGRTVAAQRAGYVRGITRALEIMDSIENGDPIDLLCEALRVRA